MTVQEHLATKDPDQHPLPLIVVERDAIDMGDDSKDVSANDNSIAGVRNSFSTMTLNKKKGNVIILVDTIGINCT